MLLVVVGCAMRCSVAVLIGLIAAWAQSGRAAEAGLFSCRIIVTGTDGRSRPEGLARCLSQVVVKVTGDPAVAGDPRAEAIVRRAPELVEDIAYVDRMSDLPHHDEQGTRDRPYDLIAHFDPERLTAALRTAGLRVWLARPALMVRATVERGGTFTLSADGDAGERQREALLAAGDRFGLRIVLPTEAQIASGTSPEVRGGALVLEGQLRWSEADFGWNARWRLPSSDAWEVRGVSFDEAFRAGVGGAAERLSSQASR